jgi:hypothetical protein
MKHELLPQNSNIVLIMVVFFSLEFTDEEKSLTGQYAK